MLDIKAASRDLQEKARDKYYKAIYYIYIYSTCSNKHRKKNNKNYSIPNQRHDTKF